MLSFLRRLHVFHSVVFILFAVVFYPRMFLVVKGEFAKGVVESYHILGPSNVEFNSSTKVPAISFKVNDEKHVFYGNINADVHKGDTVSIIYRQGHFTRACINNFWGIWRRPIIIFSILFVLWALLYTSFNSGK